MFTYTSPVVRVFTHGTMGHDWCNKGRLWSVFNLSTNVHHDQFHISTNWQMNGNVGHIVEASDTLQV